MPSPQLLRPTLHPAPTHNNGHTRPQEEIHKIFRKKFHKLERIPKPPTNQHTKYHSQRKFTRSQSRQSHKRHPGSNDGSPSDKDVHITQIYQHPYGHEKQNKQNKILRNTIPTNETGNKLTNEPN